MDLGRAWYQLKYIVLISSQAQCKSTGSYVAKKVMFCTLMSQCMRWDGCSDTEVLAHDGRDTWIVK